MTTRYAKVGTGGGGGGSGDASAAKQDAQTALLTTIDAVLDEIESTQDSELALLGTIDADTSSIASDASDSLAELEAQTALLGTTDTNVGILASSTVLTSDPASGTDRGVPAMVLRDDALTTLGPADGDWTQLRVDDLGRLWIVDGGARSSLVDSITTVRGSPPGSTPFHVHYNDTDARAAASAATVFDPPSGAITVVTDVVVSSYDTTAGKVILYFGADADTTYTIGTDVPIAIVSLVPSATQAPGVVDHPVTQPRSLAADHQIKYQNTAAIDVDIVIRGYTFVP